MLCWPVTDSLLVVTHSSSCDQSDRGQTHMLTLDKLLV